MSASRPTWPRANNSERRHGRSLRPRRHRGGTGQGRGREVPSPSRAFYAGGGCRCLQRREESVQAPAAHRHAHPGLDSTHCARSPAKPPTSRLTGHPAAHTQAPPTSISAQQNPISVSRARLRPHVTPARPVAVALRSTGPHFLSAVSRSGNASNNSSAPTTSRTRSTAGEAAARRHPHAPRARPRPAPALRSSRKTRRRPGPAPSRPVRARREPLHADDRTKTNRSHHTR